MKKLSIKIKDTVVEISDATVEFLFAFRLEKSGIGNHSCSTTELNHHKKLALFVSNGALKPLEVENAVYICCHINGSFWPCNLMFKSSLILKT